MGSFKHVRGALVASLVSAAVVAALIAGVSHAGSALYPATSGGGTSFTDYSAVAVADQQDLTISSLNCDSAGQYDGGFDVILKGGVGLTGFNLRPFGTDETTLLSHRGYINGSGVWVVDGGAGNAQWSGIFGSDASDRHLVASFHIVCKTGKYRQFLLRGSSAWAASNDLNMISTGWSTDTTTNVTALTLHGTVAGSMRAGSVMWLRALQTTY